MTSPGSRRAQHSAAVNFFGIARRAALVAALLVAGAGSTTAQQFPQVPLYEMLPTNYPYPLARVCYVGQGICDVPTYVFPGAPCACRRADGVWIHGVVTH